MMSLRLLLLCALTLPTLACYGGSHCEEENYDRPAIEPAPLRNPFTGQCESYGWGGGGGGGTCGDYATGAADQAPLPDWGICDGFCENLDESDCLANAECRGAYRIDECPQDADCDASFFQCWAITPTGPYSEEGCSTYAAEECARHNDCIAVHNWDTANDAVGVFGYCADEPAGIDPGSCVGEVTCESLPPECPANTVPGRANSCWTGFCIPLDQCDVVPSCDQQTEADCVNRDDCQALYEGINCECTGDSCVCEDWVFESCESQVAP